MNELTWNEYIDLVKKECERRFDDGEWYNIFDSSKNIGPTKLGFRYRLLKDNCAVYYEHYNRSRTLHLQPRLDWLESLKE